MGSFYAIFRNTMLEVMRQPAYGLVLAVCCGLIIAAPLSSAHVYTFSVGSDIERGAVRMVADLGLASILLCGLILAVFSATSVISREIDQKTALTVLSKRVGRTTFVFAKYAGVATAITLAMLTCVMFLLLLVRVAPEEGVRDPLDMGAVYAVGAAVLLAVLYATLRNYTRGRSWIGTFALTYMVLVAILFLAFSVLDTEYGFAPVEGGVGWFGAYDRDVAKAGILTLESVLILTGIAVAASTRLGVGGSFAVCALLFLLGLTMEYFAHQYGERVGVQTLAVLVPNLQPFGMSEALAREKPIPVSYIGVASVYAVCYIMASLFCAAFLFGKREIA